MALAPTADTAPRLISFRKLPLVLWLVALLAGGLHSLAFLRAELSTPPGWRFTGSLSTNPDEMQYRIWERRSQTVGPIVDNTFTTEPNRPYLPVFFYWTVGKVAGALNVTPAKVYAHAGAVLAFILTILVFALARHFLPDAHQHWWVFSIAMLGGGLGAHLRALQELMSRNVGTAAVVQRVASGAGTDSGWQVLEAYRGHYIIKALIDTHLLLVWVVTLAAVIAYYNALARLTRTRALIAAACVSLVIFLHVYEGVTLLAVGAAVTLCFWVKGIDRRPAITLLATVSAAAFASYAVLALVFRRSGLPFPSWHALNILFSLVLIAFPITWALAVWRGPALWASGGRDAAFLFGWVLGCLTITLSGPFFPYPDRGIMTLQVACVLLAGMLYFSWKPRMTRLAIAVALGVFAVAPVRIISAWWRFGAFSAERPFAFVDASHQRVIDTLRARAKENDVLLVDPGDVLWLGIEHPGRLYVGHFFLTVAYAEKLEAFERLLDAPIEQRSFLQQSGARFVFVNRDRQPEKFAELTELTPIGKEPAGWLFEVRPSAMSHNGAR
jgi:hypothetical protein